MRRLLATLVVTLMVAVATAVGAAPVWEEVNSPHAAITQTMEMDADTQIAVSDGYIYLWSEKPVTVKLFSILGQLIAQETVKPGLHRLRIASRGIYILRAGTSTRRITI
jgi:hypothetical protein